MKLIEVETVLDRDLKDRKTEDGWEIFFDGVEVIGGDGLSSLVCGKGKTIKEAKKDYADKLSYQRVVLNASSTNRSIVNLPKVTV